MAEDNKFKREIADILERETGKELSEVIETPKEPSMGDFALPCFVLAKELRKNPAEIAKWLEAKLKPTKLISKIAAAGPYLNFFVNKGILADEVISGILKKKKKYGAGAEGKTILVESPGPNTNKPLHLGHVRNMVLGQSMCNLYEFLGNKAYLVNVVNDRGVHICKSMLAYQKWGKRKKPDKKPDHFVGDFYVLYSQNETEDMKKEIQDMLIKWENKDKKTRALWKKMNRWCLQGFKETYKEFGLKHKKEYLESETYELGREIVEEGVEKGLFARDTDNSVYVNLTSEGYGKKILQRSDGTSVYIIQDLYMAKARYNDFKMDHMVYIVATEQIYHFKVLFRLFEILGYPFKDACYHLAYGMVNLPEGKMKSREGAVVDADELVAELKKLAHEEICTRHKELDKEEAEKRAKIIAMSALRFFILKYDAMKDMVYNPKESISFEGETGPYVQYAYARIASIFKKHGGKVSSRIKVSALGDDELRIISKLAQFNDTVRDCAKHYNPSIIARYLLELASEFNSYYHKNPVLQAEPKVRDARLVLLKCIQQVLKTGLWLLDIETLEEM